ncbi:MAG: CpsD/CapB family tyrosine-protein kinase [Herbinix sp.]|nr:CpsD/CapB family tyrosine-protein kinase [Herbinix sp.]
MIKMKKIIDFYSNTNHFINDAIDRIVVEIHLKKQRDGYKKFMISGCEPGVGTTTIAINLAISMAQSGWKTILIDGDLRKITKYKRLNDELDLGLSDYLAGESLYPQTVYDTNHKNLFYLPSGSKTVNPISLLCSVKVDEVLDQLCKDYDYVIMDMPSITTSVDANVIASKMDGVILVTEYAKTDLSSVRESWDILNKSGGNIAGIILNKINTAEYGHIKKNFDYYKNQRYINKRSKSKSKMTI